METKRVQSLVIRLNNKNLILVKQKEFRQKLDELHTKFQENVVEKLNALRRE